MSTDSAGPDDTGKFNKQDINKMAQMNKQEKQNKNKLCLGIWVVSSGAPKDKYAQSWLTYVM